MKKAIKTKAGFQEVFPLEYRTTLKPVYRLFAMILFLCSKSYERLLIEIYYENIRYNIIKLITDRIVKLINQSQSK